MKKVQYCIISILASLLLAFGGCASNTVKPRAFEVRLTLDPALAGMSLQVDLIGANTLADLPKWTTYSVTEYWQPDNPLRRDDSHLCAQFGRGLPAKLVVARDHPHWQTWLKSGVSHLVILADLPGVTSDQAGNADPRRLLIPLDKKLWNSKDPLEIVIQTGGLKLLTKQKNKKE